MIALVAHDNTQHIVQMPWSLELGMKLGARGGTRICKMVPIVTRLCNSSSSSSALSSGIEANKHEILPEIDRCGAICQRKFLLSRNSIVLPFMGSESESETRGLAWSWFTSFCILLAKSMRS